MKTSTRTLAPSAANLDGQSFKSFADLKAALVQAGEQAARATLAQNAADVKRAQGLRRTRAARQANKARRTAQAAK